MKIGTRGQVTIPKSFRQRWGLTTATEVEFVEENGQLVLKKKVSNDAGMRRIAIKSCIGVLQGRPENIDEFIENIRRR